MNDAIIASYIKQIIKLQEKLDFALEMEINETNLACAGYIINCIKELVDSLATYRETEFGM
ncbi:MAG: hypothetical protein WC877_00210 [Dehalococcoidales bacterium]|jgi:hypothetical protein